MVEDWLTDYERLADLDGSEHDQSERTFQRRDPTDDPLNAFVNRFELVREDGGPFDGVTVGVKDNINVGGVHTTCGSATFDSYRPHRDAVAVSRLLDAGRQWSENSIWRIWSSWGADSSLDTAPY